ncbi:sensor histidine kinase [Nocardioides jiangxiensis]|uniref:histidine kinase n=1 Tax=Nocardioides jiangxiensis TaxID=3064524 RepID=A0ABT9B5A8_9ACTN|nr:sensor histidine kinase [Nocardioides sp. WY-20]MDO7868787.1 sensor histidine kinase [Nocardioides sp. WY-20]
MRTVGFRRRVVLATLCLVTAVMIGLILVTQAVLELTETDPHRRTSIDVLAVTAVLSVGAVVLVGLVTWRVATNAEREVREALLAEQRLTAELAHELRTPLTALQGSADLALLRGIADEDLAEDVQEIAAAARRLGSVMATLLDGADRARPGADRAETILQAIAPLLDNALQHASSTVTVTVEDDGPGVDAGVDVFAAGESARADGHGLGLPIARRLARSVGGEVELADRSRFVLRVPR